jgi:hypothetical protein
MAAAGLRLFFATFLCLLPCIASRASAEVLLSRRENRKILGLAVSSTKWPEIGVKKRKEGQQDFSRHEGRKTKSES